MCMRLLPKKVDLSLLKNWRPISLINCDGKAFTRLLNARIAPINGEILTPYQTGFIPRRFIADNFFLLRMIMSRSRHTATEAIGLLLDQEKDYDGIHPGYLEQVLAPFGFPSSFTKIIVKLFFQNRIQVNINGHLTPAILQKSGLRQGDYKSPLLFYFVLEPLLQTIVADSSLQGIHADCTIRPPTIQTPTTFSQWQISTKALAYADDICLFLNTPEELDRVLQIFALYGRASNAKLNVSKTQVFSLTGGALPTWQPALKSHNITQWFDKFFDSYLTYLDYPLLFTAAHAKLAAGRLLGNLRQVHGLMALRRFTY